MHVKYFIFFAVSGYQLSNFIYSQTQFEHRIYICLMFQRNVHIIHILLKFEQYRYLSAILDSLRIGDRAGFAVPDMEYLGYRGLS